LDDTARWQAVLERDRRFDGSFVFAVRTTGIYCRPSCAARRPLRHNVAFFPGPDAAERAGFRDCRRCRPRLPNVASHDALVRRICDHIDAHLEQPIRLADLGAAAGMSPHHLLRTFKKTTGITPRQYADARRMGTFKARLKEGWSVTNAVFEAGYGSSSRLYEKADARLGMTPATYRRGGRGMRIGYTIVTCPLGRMLVAATDRGVSAVHFAESDEKLERTLQAEFPDAELHRNQGAHADWVEALVARIGGASVNVPVDIQATAFQWRVFDALREIPPGETRSYGEIARRLGQPKAARAVGRACATNPVAVAIPCHRAVGASGALTGYRWGVDRKRALLEAEAARKEAQGHPQTRSSRSASR
jgi:AraC family transcriptional regulator of adaptative response/methylated-DNA-[protein]-cysteine methyltransferase